MKPSKGLATWAGLVAAVGQYAAAVAVFLEADNQSDALGPLVTATATLLAVIVGRMQQAKALAAKPTAARSLGYTITGDAGHLNRAIAEGTDWTGHMTDASFVTGANVTSTLPGPDNEPGDPDALPEYPTETDPPPDEGDTSANGDTGERES